MSKQNKLQKHLARVTKGHEAALNAPGVTDYPNVIPEEVTAEEAVRIAKITNTDAGAILQLNNEVALERLNYKPPVVARAPAAQPATARSPMTRAPAAADTVVTSWKR